MAEAVSGSRVEPETRVAVTVLVPFGEWTSTVQPIAARFTTGRKQRIGDADDEIVVGAVGHSAVWPSRIVRHTGGQQMLELVQGVPPIRQREQVAVRPVTLRFGVHRRGDAQALGNAEWVAVKCSCQRVQHVPRLCEIGRRFVEPPVGMVSTAAGDDARWRRNGALQADQGFEGRIIHIDEQRRERDGVRD